MRPKIGFRIFAIFLVILSPIHAAALASQLSRVRWVDDGDTVAIADGTRVRYIGINAAEIAHDDVPAERFGLEARPLMAPWSTKRGYGRSWTGKDTISMAVHWPMSSLRAEPLLIPSW